MREWSFYVLVLAGLLLPATIPISLVDTEIAIEPISQRLLAGVTIDLALSGLISYYALVRAKELRPLISVSTGRILLLLAVAVYFGLRLGYELATRLFN